MRVKLKRHDLETHGFQIYFLRPFITFLGMISLHPQARTIIGRSVGPGPGAPLLVGLAAQVVVFFLLDHTWPGRLVWPLSVFEQAFLTWFQMVGYMPFDHITFAIVQVISLYIAIRHTIRVRERAFALTPFVRHLDLF